MKQKFSTLEVSETIDWKTYFLKRIKLWRLQLELMLEMTCCALILCVLSSCVQSARFKNNADITMIVGPRELQRVMEHFLGSVNDRFPGPLSNMSKLHNHIRWFGTNAIVADFRVFMALIVETKYRTLFESDVIS